VDPWLDTEQVTTSVLVYGEIVEFFQGLADFAHREAELRELLRDIRPYQVTDPIMRRYATLRRSMRKPYGPGLIGDVDTLIAATALEHNHTVVTLDGDFARVPGLPVTLVDRGALM
jgi:predicted nucleic acid-binding protein